MEFKLDGFFVTPYARYGLHYLWWYFPCQCIFFVWHFFNFTASAGLCLRAENIISETLSKLYRHRNLRKYVTDSVKVSGYKHFPAKSNAFRPAWKAKFCATDERVCTRKWMWRDSWLLKVLARGMTNTDILRTMIGTEARRERTNKWTKKWRTK